MPSVSPALRKAASVAAAELRRAARCSICLDTLSACTSLPCAHAFCEACINAHIDNNAGKTGFKCPMCGVVSKKRLNRRDNSLQKIVDACIEVADAFEDDLACDIELAQPLDYVHPALASPPLAVKPRATRYLDSDSDDSNQSDTEETQQPQMEIVHDEDDQQNATERTELTAEIDALPTQFQLFVVGDIVHVQSRTWPGVNKPGGVARIVGINEDGTYEVKYVIGGGESNVQPEFVHFAEELSLERRARKRVGPELLDQTETPPRSTRQNAGKRARNKSSTKSSQRTPLAPVHLNLQPTQSQDDGSQSPRQRLDYGHIMILGTHLEPNEQKWLESFADTFGVHVAHQYCAEVTHVVTHSAEVKGKQTALRRSLKLLQGIINGKWILSPLWLRDSLRQDDILEEDAYEVEAPKCEKQDATRRARLDVQRGGTLFKDVAVWLAGGFASPAPPKADLSSLLQMGGATVCTSLDALLATRRQHKVVVCGIEAEEIPEDVDVRTTRFAWVLDCVSNYRVLSFDDYPAAINS